MIIRKAFKFRLKIKPQIESKLSQFSGCCRFVWNKALALQKQRLEQKQPCLSYSKMAAALRDWKKQDETAFLKDCHSQPLQQTLMALDKTLTNSGVSLSTSSFGVAGRLLPSILKTHPERAPCVIIVQNITAKHKPLLRA